MFKLDTPFAPEPYKVVGKQGNEVTVQSSTGETYRRNVTHVKNYHSEFSLDCNPLADPNPAVESQAEQNQGPDKDPHGAEVHLGRSQPEVAPPRQTLERL